MSMFKIKLISVPAPGQCLKGETTFLGTVRIHMHKASLLAILTSSKAHIERNQISASVEIVDMQDTRDSRIDYGEIDYFSKLRLTKFRVGASFDSVRDHILDSNLIGISINYTHSRIIVADFIRYVRATNPQSLIVIGGTEASATPNYYLRVGADIIVRGEGEGTFNKIIDAAYHRRSLSQIAGTYSNLDGIFVDNYSTKKPAQLDINEILPQQLHLVDFARYTDTGEGTAPYGITPPFISIETSRGCAQACSFCATPFMQGRYRFMCVDRIISHLEHYKRIGITSLLFQEDNILSRIHRNYSNGEYIFANGRNELIRMFKIVRDFGFSWEFSNGLEFGLFEYNGVIDEELIDVMFWNDYVDGKHYGCYRATIPLENLSDSNFTLFRKLRPFNRAKKVISAIARTNVYMLNFNLIIGRPEDNLDIVRLSYDRCVEVRELLKNSETATRPFFNVYNLSLLPGTVDFRQFKHLLAFDLEKDPEVLTFYLGSLNTQYFDALEISKVRGSLAMCLNTREVIDDVDETRFLTDDRILDALGAGLGNWIVMRL